MERNDNESQRVLEEARERVRAMIDEHEAITAEMNQRIQALGVFQTFAPSNMPQVLFSDTLLHDLTSGQYSLDYLNLSHQTIESEKIAPLTAALEKNKTIKTLILSGNHDLYGQALYYMYSNQTITTLYLDSNKIGGACDLYAKRLKVNKTLTALFFGNNQIGDSGAALFGEYLALNRQLKILDLSFNLIGGSGIKALASGLTQNHGLTTLKLKGNILGVKGAIALAECLKENDTLESLDLDSCFVNNVKASVAILQGLIEKKDRSVLKELNMSRNNMGEKGAMALAKVIQVNYGLKSLEIAQNNLADKGIIIIIESIMNHPSITRIDMYMNPISSEAGAGAIVKMLEKNTRIISLEVEIKNLEIKKVLPKIRGLKKKNNETLINTAKWLVERFSPSTGVQAQIDKGILKYYQACDHGLLIKEIGEEEYEKVKKGIERYLAVNYLKLMRCVGNGKSTLEQLSPQIQVNIFSYLDLSKCLWFEEIYANFENDKARRDIQSARDKDLQDGGSKCNMW